MEVTSGMDSTEDREVVPLPLCVPIAFWHKRVGLCGHAAGASRLPGMFAVFCRSELGALANEMIEKATTLSVLHNIMR